MEYDLETLCIHLINPGQNTVDSSGAISFPIYQTSSFAHPAVGQSTGYDYSRQSNPTRDQLERIVASLENGTDAVAFSSGMSAEATLFEIFSPGDEILVDQDLYGGSVRLFNEIGKKNGLKIKAVDFSRDGWQRELGDQTKALFLETPTNPMMNVADIQKIAGEIKDRNILFIVDNTFLSPYFQNPLDLGADIVMHSGTKYLGGHNDVLSGFLVTKDPTLAEQFRHLSMTLGSVLSPFDSWLMLRGIQTLALRLEKAEQNAHEIARWLDGQPGIRKVIYPGLKSHPGHEIMKRQARGFGAMISFEAESPEVAINLLNSLNLIQFAESLGGVQTLMTYPLLQTHKDVPQELRDKNGLNDRILRLSVGIESAEDLINDLHQALQKARLTKNPNEEFPLNKDSK